MSYKVKTIPRFDKEHKRLVKKYPSLKNVFARVITYFQITDTTRTSFSSTPITHFLLLNSKKLDYYSKWNGFGVFNISDNIYLYSIKPSKPVIGIINGFNL